MVLLVASFYPAYSPDFAAFPTILLFTTLLRLALNVASTRIILMEEGAYRRGGGGGKGGGGVWSFHGRR